eukprot:g33946.t1
MAEDDALVLEVDGDSEIQEGEGGIGDGPDEFEDVVKVVSDVDELLKLLMGAQGSANTVIDVAEEEVRDGAGEIVEEGLFHVPYEETDIAWTHK